MLHEDSDTQLLSHTLCPVQNIGHFDHGSSLASASHVERYGLRTIRGNTGGVSVDAAPRLLRSETTRAFTPAARMIMQAPKQISTTRWQSARKSCSGRKKGRSRFKQRSSPPDSPPLRTPPKSKLRGKGGSSDTLDRSPARGVVLKRMRCWSRALSLRFVEDELPRRTGVVGQAHFRQAA